MTNAQYESLLSLTKSLHHKLDALVAEQTKFEAFVKVNLPKQRKRIRQLTQDKGRQSKLIADLIRI